MYVINRILCAAGKSFLETVSKLYEQGMFFLVTIAVCYDFELLCYVRANIRRKNESAVSTLFFVVKTSRQSYKYSDGTTAHVEDFV